MTTGSLPTLQDIYRARRTIGGHVVRTPLVPSIALSDAAGTPVHLKLEHQQITGSFKLRGAANALLSLDPEQRRPRPFSMEHLGGADADQLDGAVLGTEPALAGEVVGQVGGQRGRRDHCSGVSTIWNQ